MTSRLNKTEKIVISIVTYGMAVLTVILLFISGFRPAGLVFLALGLPLILVATTLKLTGCIILALGTSAVALPFLVFELHAPDLFLAFVAMSLKAKSIIANPGDILIILAPLTVFYLISYVMLSIVGKLFFQRGNAVAMVYGVVMRDLSIALAIAINAFGEQGSNAALVIAVSYIIQVQSAAWYVKFTDKLFGPPPQEEV